MTDAPAPVSMTAWIKKINWLPCLLAPAALVAFALFIKPEFNQGQIQTHLENAGPILLGIAACVFAVRAAITRNPWHLIFTCLVITLFCRELHFAGTSDGVYVALGLIGVWIIAWNKKLRAIPVDWRLTSWLIATVWAYVLAQLVDRRMFSPKYLNLIPDEKIIHSTVEEAMETLAHILMICTAIIEAFYQQPGEAVGSVPPGKSDAESAG